MRWYLEYLTLCTIISLISVVATSRIHDRPNKCKIIESSRGTSTFHPWFQRADARCFSFVPPPSAALLLALRIFRTSRPIIILGNPGRVRPFFCTFGFLNAPLVLRPVWQLVHVSMKSQKRKHHPVLPSIPII